MFINQKKVNTGLNTPCLLICNMILDMSECDRPVENEIVEWEGKQYLYTWIEGDDLTQFKPYSLVHSICFNGEVHVLIQNENGVWRFQGGGPENNETFQETVTREMTQETGIIPKGIHLFGAFKVRGPLNDQNENDFFQVCTVSVVDRTVIRTPDPEDGTIDEIRFVKPDEANFYVNWGEHGRQMLRAAIKYQK